MDYLNVLWKWKYLILLGTVACAVVAGIVSFNMTKIYSIKTVLAPGVAKVEGGGKTTYIGSIQEIKTLIETGVLEPTVLKQIKVLDEEDLPRSLSFKMTTPKGSNVLEVAYETPHIDLGLQILNHLNQALLQKFDAIVKYCEEEYTIQARSKANESSRIAEKIAKAKSDIAVVRAENRSLISEIGAKITEKNLKINAGESEKETQTNKMRNMISSINAQILGKQMQIKNLENRLSDIGAEILRIGKNTDLLLKERDTFLSIRKNENNILASVMYTNTIQQNISYLNTLQGAASMVNHQIYQENVAVEELKNDIKDLEAQEINLKKQTEYNKETLLSDIKDYQYQVNSMEEQSDSKTKSLLAGIVALESEKSYIAEEMKNLEFKKNYVQNIQILQPPKRSLSPIKPKKKLIILLAGVIGLFLTVFLAFFIEYIARHKDNESDS
jgi:capsular polysaccharide biosynthesis protein